MEKIKSLIKNDKTFILKLMILVLILSVLGHSINVAFIFGRSMYPYYNDKSIAICERITPKLSKNPFERFDIIIFKHGKELYVKRVIGLPGETVEIKNDAVYINGEKLKDDVGFGKTTSKWSCVQVPDDSYFVLGDNRERSHDSRYSDIGCVKRNLVKAKIIKTK